MKNKIVKILLLFVATSLLTLTILCTITSGILVASGAHTTKQEVYIQSIQEELIREQIFHINRNIYSDRFAEDFVEDFEKMDVNYKIAIYREDGKELYSNIDVPIDGLPSFDFVRYGATVGYEDLSLKAYYQIDEELRVEDGLRFATHLSNFAYDLKEHAISMSFAFGILTILSFILYVHLSKNSLTWIDKIPSDIYLILVFIILILGTLPILSLINNRSFNSFEFYLVIDYLLIMSFIGLVSIKSLIVRIMHKQLFSNSIIGKICKIISGKIGQFKLTLKRNYQEQSGEKVFLSIIIFILMQFLLRRLTGSVYPFILLFELVYLSYRLMIFMKELDEVSVLGCNIASGKLEQVGNQVYTDAKLEALASNLQKIQEGVKHAVNNELKNERLKTELISNVSHDLKTPLTAIISYLDLLEHANEEQEKEYIEILVKQSHRMKKLIDDLLEMSKVSSGAIHIDKDELNLSLLLTQVVGEYQDKYDNKELDLIVSIEKTILPITSDPDLMWRVFSNLFSNAYRYAKEGTRVYVDLKHDEDVIVFSIKNTSLDPLNISSEELMERFVQGDRSRNTEGSGLGLSIVGNILELLEMDYRISIDGDLFKFEIFIDDNV